MSAALLARQVFDTFSEVSYIYTLLYPSAHGTKFGQLLSHGPLSRFLHIDVIIPQRPCKLVVFWDVEIEAFTLEGVYLVTPIAIEQQQFFTDVVTDHLGIRETLDWARLVIIWKVAQLPPLCRCRTL